ncbi:MAG: hypothetical protein QXU40_03495 [Candidatus Pacearchaeota archaeon]
MAYLQTEFLLFLLFFFLVFIIALQIFGKIFRERRSIAIIISLSIALLSTYYFSDVQTNILKGSYTLFGVIILTAIPFIIAFFFIYLSDTNPVFRRFFWVFFSVVYFVLLQRLRINKEIITKISFVFITMILILIIFDKTIKNRVSYVRNIKRKTNKKQT